MEMHSSALGVDELFRLYRQDRSRYEEPLLKSILTTARKWCRFDEDAAQQTLIAVWQRLDTYSNEKPLTYLMRYVARRRYVDTVRQLVRDQARFTLLDEATQLPPPADDHAISAPDDLYLGLIEDPVDRKICRMLVAGKTQTEASKVLGCTPQRVSQRLKRMKIKYDRFLRPLPNQPV